MRCNSPVSRSPQKFISFRRTLVVAAFIAIALTAAAAYSGNSAAAGLRNLIFGLESNSGAAVPPSAAPNPITFEAEAAPAAPTMLAIGDLIAARSGHTATLLNGGGVLIAGGSGDTSAEIIDAASGTSTATGSLSAARSGHTATKLSDGRVLIAGGSGDSSTEIYDPASGTFTAGPNMTAARSGHTATTLSNGNILFTGGGSDSAEVFDGTTFSAAGSLGTSRTNHSAALMADGRVFIAGGTGSNTAEIYDPSDGSSSAAGNAMFMERARALLRVLPDGKVQIIGGNSDGSMEVYDPSIDTIGAYAHVVPESDPCANLINYVLAAQTRSALIFSDSSTAERDRSGFTVTELGSSAILVGGSDANGATNTITSFSSSAAMITTDKLDYQPGDTATISGTGFEPGETVRVMIHEDPHTPQERGFDAVADASGNFSGTYLVQDYDLNMKFVAGARGLTSGNTAQTTFTDARNWDFNVLGTGSGSVLIQVNLGTISIPVGCGTINSSTSVTVTSTCSPNISTSDNAATVTFLATANPGSNFAGWSGLGNLTPATGAGSCSGTNNPCNGIFGGNGSLTVTFNANANTTTSVASSANPSTYGDNVTFTATVVAGVTPVTAGSVTFIEGGTCAAPTTLLAGPTALNGSGQAAFSIATLSVPSHTIIACYGGASGFNSSNGSVTQTVNKKTLTASIIGNSTKVYDGNTNATLAPANFSLTGLIGTDSFTVTKATGSYNDADVGSKTVSTTLAVGDFTALGGTLASNYTLPTSASGPGTITPATADCSSVAGASYVYDGNPHVGVGSCDDLGGNPIAGLTWGPGQTNVPGGLVSWSFTSANPNYANNPGGSVQVDITPAPTITIVTCPISEVYTGSAIEPCTFTVTGANLSIGPSPLASSDYTNNINVGTANASYTYVPGPNHTGSNDSETFEITPASTTTVVTCPVSEVYTGSPIEPCTFTVTGANLGIGPSPLAASDYSNNTDVGTANASYTYVPDTNHTGSNDSETFEITHAPTTTVITCPLSVVYTGSAQEPCTAEVTGVAGFSEAVAVTYTNNINVGTAQANATFTGNLNHAASSASEVEFQITQAATALVVSPATGTYGGTVDLFATLTRTDAPLGPLSGKAVNFKLNGNSVGSAITDINGEAELLGVYLTSNGTPGGTRIPADFYGNGVEAAFAAETNYTGSSDLADLQVDQKFVTASVTATNKVYDGNNAATINSCTLAVLEDGDVVTCDAAGPNTFASVNAGSGITVTATNISIAGTDSGNYVLSSTSANTTANILTKGLSATLIAADKEYNGNDVEPNANMSCSFTGIVTGEEPIITCTPSAGTFNSKDVLSANLVTATVTLGGLGAANYTLGPDGTAINSTSATDLANITPRTLTASIIGNPTKPYDGNTNATLTPANFSLAVLVATESFVVTQTAGSYNDPDVADANTVTATLKPAHFTEGPGTLASNYTLPTTASGPGTITKADTITTVTCPVSEVYNGSAQTPCSASVTGPGALNQVLTVNYTDNTNAGTANASASYAGDANYNPSSDSATFQILQADTVTDVTCPVSVAYNGSAQTPCSASVTGPGGLNQVLMVNYTDNTNAGTANASASYAGDANYNPSNDSETFEITQAPTETVITCPSSVVYNGTPQEPCTAEVTGVAAFVEAVTPITYANNTNVGTATANASFAGNLNYAASTATQVTFDITPATPTVNVTGGTFVYDANPHAASATSIGALSESVSGSFTFTYMPPGTSAAPVNAGSYSVLVNFTSSDTNYTNAVGNGSITINQAPTSTTVTCPVSLVYNGFAQTPCTVSVKRTGPPVVEILTPTPTYSANQNVGTATANYTYAGDANHVTSSGSANFQITVAPLTITAANRSKIFGQVVIFDMTTPSTDFSVAGLLGTDSVSSITLTSTGAAAGGTVGSHPIIPSAANGTGVGNYFISYVNGTLTISAWTLTGFYQPVGIPNTYGILVPPMSGITWNSIKGGQTVPLKFNIYAGSVEQTSTSAIAVFSVGEVNCNVVGTYEDPVDFVTTGATELRYTGTPGVDGQFIQNWKTPSTPNKCFRTVMQALDGSVLVSFFKTKK